MAPRIVYMLEQKKKFFFFWTDCQPYGITARAPKVDPDHPLPAHLPGEYSGVYFSQLSDSQNFLGIIFSISSPRQQQQKFQTYQHG